MTTPTTETETTFEETEIGQRLSRLYGALSGLEWLLRDSSEYADLHCLMSASMEGWNEGLPKYSDPACSLNSNQQKTLAHAA